MCVITVCVIFTTFFSQKHTDPPDAYPQHCFSVTLILIRLNPGPSEPQLFCSSASGMRCRRDPCSYRLTPCTFRSSVGDPWHFGTDPYLWLTDLDADPEHWYIPFILQIKKSYRSYKSVKLKIKVFLTVFAWWWKDPDLNPYLWLTDANPNPWGPKTYGSSLSTTQHCFLDILDLIPLKTDPLESQFFRSSTSGMRCWRDPFSYRFAPLKAVLGIRDILVPYGSVLATNGSGRPKNIRIRSRIPNKVHKTVCSFDVSFALGNFSEIRCAQPLLWLIFLPAGWNGRIRIH